MIHEFYIRCVHCNTVDFDARFDLRFKNHDCCSYEEPQQLVKKKIQLIFWANGECGLDEHVRFSDSKSQKS